MIFVNKNGEFTCDPRDRLLTSSYISSVLKEKDLDSKVYRSLSHYFIEKTYDNARFINAKSVISMFSSDCDHAYPLVRNVEFFEYFISNGFSVSLELSRLDVKSIQYKYKETKSEILFNVLYAL